MRPLEELEHRINHLERLEPGWYEDFDPDEKLGKPVFPGVIKFLLKNIDVLRESGPWVHLFPTLDGGVSIEWLADRVSTSLEIEPDFTGFFMVLSLRTHDVTYHKNYTEINRESLQEALTYAQDSE